MYHVCKIKTLFSDHLFNIAKSFVNYTYSQNLQTFFGKSEKSTNPFFDDLLKLYTQDYHSNKFPSASRREQLLKLGCGKLCQEDTLGSSLTSFNLECPTSLSFQSGADASQCTK